MSVEAMLRTVATGQQYTSLSRPLYVSSLGDQRNNAGLGSGGGLLARFCRLANGLFRRGQNLLGGSQELIKFTRRFGLHTILSSMQGAS